MKPVPLIRLLTLALALAALGPTAAWAEDPSHADHTIVLPADLKWEDSKATPGAKVAVIEGPANEPLPYILRVKFPADYEIPAHWHPSPERVTVISGTFNLGTGDKLDKEKTKALLPGSTAIIQPKTNHFGWFSEETVVQLHGVGPQDINFVDPADDPRKK
jgi:quercetin dioxygenase-like cupin family protein